VTDSIQDPIIQSMVVQLAQGLGLGHLGKQNPKRVLYGIITEWSPVHLKATAKSRNSN
jgi:hypothetical protein